MKQNALSTSDICRFSTPAEKNTRLFLSLSRSPDPTHSSQQPPYFVSESPLTPAKRNVTCRHYVTSCQFCSHRCISPDIELRANEVHHLPAVLVEQGEVRDHHRLHIALHSQSCAFERVSRPIQVSPAVAVLRSDAAVLPFLASKSRRSRRKASAPTSARSIPTRTTRATTSST